MKIMKALLASFTLCIVLSCGCRLALADEPDATSQALRQQDRSAMLNKYDVNHDGKLDAEEAKRRGRDMLLIWDTNHDGKLDKREIRAMQRAQHKTN